MKALREAQQVAAMLRRSGYPEAIAAPEYCVDAEIGMDNFYTYTVSVYAGPYRLETVPNPIKRAMEKIRSRVST